MFLNFVQKWAISLHFCAVFEAVTTGRTIKNRFDATPTVCIDWEFVISGFKICKIHFTSNHNKFSSLHNPSWKHTSVNYFSIVELNRIMVPTSYIVHFEKPRMQCWLVLKSDKKLDCLINIFKNLRIFTNVKNLILKFVKIRELKNF